MRRIYLVIIVILVAGAFIGGYYLGSKDDSVIPAENVTAIIKHRDSLQQILSVKNRIEKALRETLVVQKAKTNKSDSVASTLKALLISQAKEHGRKIAAVKMAVKKNLDSASVAKIDTTKNIHSDSIDILNPDVLMAKYDSVTDYAFTEAQIIEQQNESILDRDSTISTQAQIIEQKDQKEENLNGQLDDQKKLTDAAVADAKKKKRQRNEVIAGAVAVVVLVLLL